MFLYQMTRYSQRFLNNASLCGKIFWYSNIVYYWCALKALLCKNWFYFFFLIFCHPKVPPYFRTTRLSFFKCFAFPKFTSLSQKSDMNYSIRVIFVKVIIMIQINFIKIYSNNISLISNKCDLIKIFIMKEYIIMRV